MTLGFIGTGTISAALVDGLQSSSVNRQILLSPRNEATAARLSAQFTNVKVASSNQAVLDGSDIVILAIRPQVAHAVLSELHFRPDHRVVSLVPAVTLEYLRAATAPSATVSRAVPLPSVARRQSPTVIFPADPAVTALFNQVGNAIELDREDQFEAFTAVTALMSSYFRLAHTVTAWMQDNGIAAPNAQAFVAQILQGLSGALAVSPQSGFAELTEEHQTRGGLNEQVLQSLTDAGVFKEVDRALDGILARLKVGPSK